MTDGRAAAERQLEQLCARMDAPETYSDPALYAKLARERKSLEPLVDCYRRRDSLLAQIADAEALLDDPELQELAKSELAEARAGLEQTERELKLLRLPPDEAEQLIGSRYHGDEGKKDIHERDDAYLRSAHKAAEYCASKCGWHTVDCLRASALRSVDDIHAEVLQTVLDFLGTARTD